MYRECLGPQLFWLMCHDEFLDVVEVPQRYIFLIIFFVSEHFSSATEKGMKCHMRDLCRYLRKPSIQSNVSFPMPGSTIMCSCVYVLWCAKSVESNVGFPMPGPTLMCSCVYFKVQRVFSNVDFSSAWIYINVSCVCHNLLKVWKVMWVFQCIYLHEGAVVCVLMYRECGK